MKKIEKNSRFKRGKLGKHVGECVPGVRRLWLQFVCSHATAGLVYTPLVREGCGRGGKDGGMGVWGCMESNERVREGKDRGRVAGAGCEFWGGSDCGDHKGPEKKGE